MKYAILFGSSSLTSLALKQQKFKLGAVYIFYESKIPCSIFHDQRTVKIQFLEYTWIYLPTFDFSTFNILSWSL